MTANGLAAMTALALATACRATHDLAPADVASYDDLATDVSGQLQAYCSAAAGMSSASGCTAALRQYLDRVRPDIAGMGPLAGRIDDHMMGAGMMPAGDMRCGMDLMSREVERHAGVACTSADMGANRAEAQRHCDRMQGYADHMRMRGAEAGGTMGPGMMGPGSGSGPGMMNGGSDGGWRMPDGGMMDWDHQIPGCAADGGA